MNQCIFKIWLSDMIKPLKRSGSACLHLLKTLESRPAAGRECGPQGAAGLEGLGGHTWSMGVLASPGHQPGHWGLLASHLLTLAKDPGVYSMMSWLHIHLSLYVAFLNTPEELENSWMTQRGSLRGQGGAESPLHVQGPLGVCSTYLPNVFTIFLQRQ